MLRMLALALLLTAISATAAHGTESAAPAAPDPTAMTRTQIGMSLLFMTRCIISE